METKRKRVIISIEKKNNTLFHINMRESVKKICGELGVRKKTVLD